ncbi:hypothetical protein N7448_006151, partial [Penicillium atrosanguineum]
THPVKIPFWRILVDQGASNQAILDHEYPGSGTEHDPFVVTWIPNDCRDPHLFSFPSKICIMLVAASSTLILIPALDVLGFAIGPLLWAPLSELCGRQISFLISLSGMAAFLAGCAAAPHI